MPDQTINSNLAFNGTNNNNNYSNNNISLEMTNNKQVNANMNKTAMSDIQLFDNFH